MRGLDYRWLEALDHVISYGGFEPAANSLCITQSAVSQRIKQLEKLAAKPVLIRGSPPIATPTGQQLLGLYRRVMLLESEVLPDIVGINDNERVTVSLATNADSLATWLLPALSPLMDQQLIELDLLVDNELLTLDKLKSGEAIAAISSEPKSLASCQSDFLGYMEYICVCSPEFYQRFFSDGLEKTSICRAPAVVFDKFDPLHAEFLQYHFDAPPDSWRSHLVRSSEAFITMAKLGVSYASVPTLMAAKDIENGSLINMCPGKSLHRPLYWQRFNAESGILRRVSETCIQYARQALIQKK
ncbi:ArgP/LysG family DNA-binding transcriptional regulator [Veronia nyctiphanis]|uniref:ArgP/LysG family DNA-binding transcriptional regulator n=1 Tax=Veronia nyctiphanis TaxID=1278244 RepID=A0A4Q0YN29_9GAMM|nr:LysR family transcriptional regulator ArgP [Veronia nyctiphanis]RXJ72320.1 ArgP/LysG family DNA-binding transcriptional regulator [Veronia nyctiphanis]